MKINAIEGCGSCKDFIDMYFLLQHYTLDDLLQFYSQKYPNHSIFRALLSLTYFEDAEREALPQMLAKQTREEMKVHILQVVSDYQRR